MRNDNDIPADAAELRLRAEEKLKERETDACPPASDIDALRVVYELQVHQIELEMQNEELLRSQVKVVEGLERYTSLYDFAPVGYFTLDRQGNIRQVNQTGAHLLNIGRSKLLGKRFLVFVAPESRIVFANYLEKTFKMWERESCEIQLLTEGEDRLFVRIDASTYEGECHISVIDITERKLAEEALTRSKEQVSQILESISDAFFTLDRDWRFTYVNKEAQCIMQKSREQLIGVKIWDHFPEAVGTMFQTEYERAVSEGASAQFESYYPPFDTWYEVRAYPFQDGLSVYFRDCSLRRAGQEVLAQASERNAHIADMLQRIILPPQISMQIPGYETATRYHPALLEAEVCGDFYDVFDMGEGKIGIVIGDILGKGLMAAVRVAAVRHTIRSYAFLDDRPSRIIELVNDALVRDIATESDMLTAFFAVLDTRVGSLAYSNAGHEPPLFMRSDGSIEFLEKGGLMFMGMSEQKYSEGILTLGAGDVFVMVTDGITEARKGCSCVQFGAEGVAACLSVNASASAEEIASRIVEASSSFADGKLRDDVAVVVIKKII